MPIIDLFIDFCPLQVRCLHAHGRASYRRCGQEPADDQPREHHLRCQEIDWKRVHGQDRPGRHQALALQGTLTAFMVLCGGATDVKRSPTAHHLCTFSCPTFYNVMYLQVLDKSNKPHVKVNIGKDQKEFSPEEVSAMVSAIPTIWKLRPTTPHDTPSDHPLFRCSPR